MTTIKSAFEYSPRTLEVEKGRKYEGGTYLRIMNGMFAGEDIQIPTADLLAALDAVPRDALAGSEECRLATEKKLAEAETELEAWKHTVSVLDDELRDSQELLGQRAVELHKARAERDALAKTVERVRKLTACGAHSLLPETIRAALDPKPAFVLPTEVPARIEAKRDGKTYTFYLWTNGSGGSNDLIWVDEDDWTHSPSPKRLMRDFTGHRFLPADGDAE